MLTYNPDADFDGTTPKVIIALLLATTIVTAIAVQSPPKQKPAVIATASPAPSFSRNTHFHVEPQVAHTKQKQTNRGSIKPTESPVESPTETVSSETTSSLKEHFVTLAKIYIASDESGRKVIIDGLYDEADKMPTRESRRSIYKVANTLILLGNNN